MKKIGFAALLMLMLFAPCMGDAQEAQEMEPLETGTPFTITSPSALLMEASTGRVIFEQNADERRPVASVTKVMTILLTLEAVDEGKAGLDDRVMVSDRAMSMGGSQVFLEANQSYKLRELLKSVIVASANDAAVALAEYMDGSEEAFVRRMNARAKELGLEDTHYVNCTGLPAQGHYTTARDVARLSAQLDRHPLYYEFSTIWMDEIAHRGGRKTQITNTNRLVRFYEGCDGYKTGSTNEARYCMSATAEKNGLRLIAVVLGANAGQTRFDEASAMLEYGFSAYQLFVPVKEGDALGMQIPVRLGRQDSISAVSGRSCALLMRKGEEKEVSLEAALPQSVTAPVKKGDVVGEIRVKRGERVVTTLPAVAGEDAQLPGIVHALLRIRDRFLLKGKPL